MATRGLRSRRRYGGGPRRRSSWELGPGGVAPATATASGQYFIGNVATAGADGLTVVRSIGCVKFTLTGTGGGVTDGFYGAVGLGICNADAAAIGITAVSTPISDVGDENWLWWAPFQLAGGYSSGDSRVCELRFDTRAMRQMDIGELDTLYLAMEITEVGVESLTYWGDSRILVKLP